MDAEVSIINVMEPSLQPLVEKYPTFELERQEGNYPHAIKFAATVMDPDVKGERVTFICGFRGT